MVKPGPWANECDCDEEPMCAMHKAARALLEALEQTTRALDAVCEVENVGVYEKDIKKARAAIRAARGPEDRDDDNLSTRRAAKGE